MSRQFDAGKSLQINGEPNFNAACDIYLYITLTELFQRINAVIIVNGFIAIFLQNIHTCPLLILNISPLFPPIVSFVKSRRISLSKLTGVD